MSDIRHKIRQRQTRVRIKNGKCGRDGSGSLQPAGLVRLAARRLSGEGRPRSRIVAEQPCRRELKRTADCDVRRHATTSGQQIAMPEDMQL